MALDAVIVGSGPNGLAAAITLAQAGRSVLVVEAGDTPGGGMRSKELTLPGFVHDVCSAIHPLGVASPFFQSVPLADFGLKWIHPDVPLCHPLSDGTVAVVHRDLGETANDFGLDTESYKRLLERLVAGGPAILDDALRPLHVPRHPMLMMRFGLHGMQSAQRLARRWFREPRVQGMFAGMAAHSVLPLDRSFTAAVGLMFCITAHGGGWPLAEGGSQSIANAMVNYLVSLGGTIECGTRITSLGDLPSARTILFDITPRQLCEIAGDVLPSGYRRRLERFRHGPGAFKIDWALSDPIPWKSAACRRAGTVHVGGTFEEVAAAEQAAWSGTPADHPFVLVAQQSLFDPTRAPKGKHTGWGYCHVPHGSTDDYTERIESQLERFAPGFRDTILARHIMRPADFETYNPNYIGGDITGGVMDAWQMFARPVPSLNPYAIPGLNGFLCSSSTPPGPGVHGMCGLLAAQAALKGALKE